MEMLGFHELAGMRQRYRIIDMDRVCEISGFGGFKDFSRWHSPGLESSQEKTAGPFPFDALAVGNDEKNKSSCKFHAG